jgi:putative transposase
VPSKLDNKEHVSFVTNRAVTTDSATALADLYPERWGIETSYRVTKDFMGKTTSTDYAVRLFYFLFGVLLYNVWILVNAIVARSIGHPATESPPVTAKYLMTVLRGLREGIT